ncbi:shikimate kinase [Flavimobilis soli]|uniref:Shikimate kinase n=1 Tax=Flavimobilis soli TaxID=442709 RepID=A0A2A9E9A3_9MICO|nr:shikimate kinase [Flavimobilis soli]
MLERHLPIEDDPRPSSLSDQSVVTRPSAQARRYPWGVPEAFRPRVILSGPPGSGKTTVAAEIGAATGWQVRDTDADVETLAGKSVTDIFVEDGEDAFRALERRAVATALEEHDGVLALGGGAVLDEGTQALLAQYVADGGTVVFLDVSLAHAAPRVGFNTARPLLAANPRAQWQALMTARRPVYEKVGSLHVLTDDLEPAAVAAQILAALDAAQPGGTR